MRLVSPRVYIPSGLLLGQTHARMVEQLRAAVAAMSSITAGRVDQNQSEPPLDENRVRKSDTDTFKYTEVVI